MKKSLSDFMKSEQRLQFFVLLKQKDFFVSQDKRIKCPVVVNQIQTNFHLKFLFPASYLLFSMRKTCM